MIRCGPNEIENETDMKVADSLTTWRRQRAREAICRKSAQTFHLPLVKYEDEYSFKSRPIYQETIYLGLTITSRDGNKIVENGKAVQKPS